mgnify:CR=1 FL=1
MALVRGRVNPLNVLGLRRLSHIPPHFAKMSTTKVDRFEQLDTWIYARLDSRYCIKKAYILDQSKKLVEVLEIGVEDPKELSMLTLGCTHLY